jgi:hypothetical protein
VHDAEVLRLCYEANDLMKFGDGFVGRIHFYLAMIEVLVVLLLHVLNTLIPFPDCSIQLLQNIMIPGTSDFLPKVEMGFRFL